MTVTAEGDLLWTPSAAFAAQTNIAQFMKWLRDERGHAFADYEALRRWSVTETEPFWAAIWDYFAVESSRPYDRVLTSSIMPGARWFPGSLVNYAEHVLRGGRGRGERIAIHHRSELRAPADVTWAELTARVHAVASGLRELGIVPGDRIVSYMPNIVETVIAMLATTAIGAVWSSAAPEFGAGAVIDRFAQIRPRLGFFADGYTYAGKELDRTSEARAIVAALPTLEHAIVLPYLNPDARFGFSIPEMTWAQLAASNAGVPADFHYERVPEDHPLWVLFTSGTTGLPKAIVHGHIGIIIETLKNLAFHMNLGPESTMFFYSTTGWMMWNLLVNAMMLGTKIVLYDGHPAYPEPDLLWTLAANARATQFGASPAYVQMMRQRGVCPRLTHDVSSFASILLSGSPATAETIAWFYQDVKADLWVTSQSGGTEFCSGLVGAVPILPVYAGEIQARGLGMDVQVFDDAGAPLIGEIGELVLTTPAPSMPLRFWDDPGNERYLAAYFDRYPGVWRHGDFMKINERGGCYVYGRSDATLNRFGVRIGSAEVYRVLDEMPQIAESLIVCLELPDGGFYMPLFVKPAPHQTFGADMQAAIVTSLRTQCSPRHVPDAIFAVPAIPYTRSAKKMEIPIRRILTGSAAAEVASPEMLADPASLDWYIAFAAEAPELAPFRT